MVDQEGENSLGFNKYEERMEEKDKQFRTSRQNSKDHPETEIAYCLGLHQFALSSLIENIGQVASYSLSLYE